MWQVYGVGGELLAEYAAGAAPGQPRTEYGYRGGELLVTAEPSSAETVWVDDSLPAGASGFGDGEDWNWVGANPPPTSGSVSHQSNFAGRMHQHHFAGATCRLSVAAGEKLYAYVYLDPSNPPSEVMLQWNSDQEGWNHRSYWGANNIAWGTDVRVWLTSDEPCGRALWFITFPFSRAESLHESIIVFEVRRKIPPGDALKGNAGSPGME